MTIASLINQMSTDLTKLAAHYNEDEQYQMALIIQTAVVAVDEVANQIAEIGESEDAWPPRDGDRQ